MLRGINDHFKGITKAITVYDENIHTKRQDGVENDTDPKEQIIELRKQLKGFVTIFNNIIIIIIIAQISKIRIGIL